MKSHADLLDASGYRERRADFDALLAILDGQLRLITPTDPDESAGKGDGSSSSEAKYFQLTHDFLVPSLRQWLTRKQQESRRGRAELRLEELSGPLERAARDSASPFDLRVFADSHSDRQREMDRSGTEDDAPGRSLNRHPILRDVLPAFSLSRSRACWLGISIGNLGRKTLSEISLGLEPKHCPMRYGKVQPFADRAKPILLRHLQDRYPEYRLHAACALASLGEHDFEFPVYVLKDSSPDESPNVFNAFQGASGPWISQLEEQIKLADEKQSWAYKARLAILALHQGILTPAEEMLEFVDRSDPTQRTVFIKTFENWHGDLSRLRQIVARATHPGLRSGVCLAVGRVSEVDAATKADWGVLLSEWHQSQPDAGTHSASWWTLRQWNMAVPEVNVSNNQTKPSGWTVTSKTQLTLIRIPPGSSQESGGEIPGVLAE